MNLDLTHRTDDLKSDELSIIGYIDNKKDEIVSLLKETVNINSSSDNFDGIAKVGELFIPHLEEMGFSVQIIESPNAARHIVAKSSSDNSPRILLMAHLDTVYSKKSPFQRFQRKGDIATGPGVVDDKGSAVVMLYALKALKSFGDLDNADISVILNGDEEIGSGSSREIIESEAKERDICLAFEPARKSGAIVKERKGGGRVKITVRGKSAHSGINPEDGISAIEEISHKIIRIQRITDYDKRLTVSVGKIEGGSKVNIIPDGATAEVDVRFIDVEDGEEALKRIRKIVEYSYVQGTKSDFDGGITRPSMRETEDTAKLVDFWIGIGKLLKEEITAESTGGGGDANFTSALGVPTIDGLGPVGGDMHTFDEYIELSTLYERTKVAAIAIRSLLRGGENVSLSIPD